MTVAQPVRRVVTDSLELTGNTQAIYTVQLVARVAGYLEKVLFQDGQLVKKGQPLFLIQQNTYEASLRQAEAQILLQQAQLEYAQKQLERFSNLLPNNAASQTDVDNWRYQRDSARANLQAAQAQRDLAQLNLDYTTVTAPFDGRIDRRLQDPGNLVGSGGNTVLAQLSQIDPIYVYFNISDLDLARLLKSTHGIPGPGGCPEMAGLRGPAERRRLPPPGVPRFCRHQSDHHHGHPADAGRLAQPGRKDPSGLVCPGARAARAEGGVPGSRGGGRS